MLFLARKTQVVNVLLVDELVLLDAQYFLVRVGVLLVDVVVAIVARENSPLFMFMMGRIVNK